MKGAWVRLLISAQVMISRSVSSSPASGSALTAQSPGPASDSAFLHLSAPPLLMLCISLSLNNKETFKKKFFFVKMIKHSFWILLPFNEREVTIILIIIGTNIAVYFSPFSMVTFLGKATSSSHLGLLPPPNGLPAPTLPQSPPPPTYSPHSRQRDTW